MESGDSARIHNEQKRTVTISCLNLDNFPHSPVFISIFFSAAPPSTNTFSIRMCTATCIEPPSTKSMNGT